ncbi:MAG: peptidoglycan recognition family protein [Phycisphaerales bacterium JB050]
MAGSSRTSSPNRSAADALRRLSRPQIVWASLLLAMTVMTGLLSLMTGAPSTLKFAPAASTVPSEPGDWLESVLAPADAIEGPKWDGIVIHHTASIQGSLESVTRQHEMQGLNGLGYHFLIGNGNGAEDGELLVGYRWQEQQPGAHVAGPMSERYNATKIGICLIGDGDSRGFTSEQMSTLMQIVRAMQERFDIPDEAVELHRDVASTSSPGRFFPQASFENGLLHASR